MKTQILGLEIGKRALDRRHISQELVPRTKSFVRCKIPDLLEINPVLDSSKLELVIQVVPICRYTRREKPNIPSFTATKSLLLAKPERCVKSRIAFTPIIPYPATYFDTIYTCMVNIQDVLSQKDLE